MSTGPILIIDDQEGIREILKLSLEEDGFQTYSAANGLEALEVLRKIPRPCLILLDLMMPVMDGKGFIEAIKRDESLAQLKIPIVLITAFNQDPIEGVQGILNKPMDMDSLLKTAHNFCH